ncbi:Hypothetical predicted protein [Octopus vulgaris]|uniref:Uncharacterized protein n=1 Tax=Octopus vulgaris TaxID=6645 RepID=A0AA36AT39_OCTVU|nr:Hypothetical predicted protein [Octopus vulgaris]
MPLEKNITKTVKMSSVEENNVNKKTMSVPEPKSDVNMQPTVEQPSEQTKKIKFAAAAGKIKYRTSNVDTKQKNVRKGGEPYKRHSPCKSLFESAVTTNKRFHTGEKPYHGEICGK